MSRFLEVPCTKCHLHMDATTVKVSSKGSNDPIVLFIGEAPGPTEDRKGVVFTGKAGKKLDALLKEAELDPSICRWTNLIRCLPRRPDGVGVRPPEPHEVEACRDYLEAEILSTNPVYIVALGKEAAKFFIQGVKSLKSIHGKKFVAHFPSLQWRYKKLRKWLAATEQDLTLFPVTSVPKKMSQQLLYAEELLGFPQIETKRFTVVPTYHPAAILHQKGNPQAKEYEQHLIADLSYVASQIKGEDSIPWESYELLSSIEEIKDKLDSVRTLYRTGEIKYVGLDLETTSVEIYLCSFYEVLLLSICYGEGKAFSIPLSHPQSPFAGDSLAISAIVELLNEFLLEVPVVGHFLQFDVKAGWAIGIDVKFVYDDSFLQSWTLFNDTITDHKLESLATKFTKMVHHKEELQEAFEDVPEWMPLERQYLINVSDSETPRYCIRGSKDNIVYRPRHFGDVDITVLFKYCCADSDSSYRLVGVFERMLVEQNLYDAHRRLTAKMVLPVARMEHYGIRLDLDMFEIARQDFQNRVDSYVQWFMDEGYFDEVTSVLMSEGKKIPKQIKLSSYNTKRIILYDILGLPVVGVTKTGEPSTDKNALEAHLQDLVQQDSDVAEYQADLIRKIRSFSKDNKILTSYLNPIPSFADDNKIAHTHIGIRTTDTGRCNCKSPSWHIIPWHSIVKKAVRPHHQDGLIMIVDYSQMELRILAMVTGDERLMQAFAEGKDLHRYVASQVFGKPEDEITKAQRRRTKAVDFGLIFGRGAAAIAAQEGISIDEAQSIIDGFFETFPAVKKWINKQHNAVQKYMEIWTCSGFRRLFVEGLYDEGELNRRAQNTPIQGPAADATDHAAIYMDGFLQKAQMESKMWCTIHDSLCLSIWPGELIPVAMLARKAMVDFPLRFVDWLRISLQNDYEVGATWGELLEMKVVDSTRIETDGPTSHHSSFAETVINWEEPPDMIHSETHMEEGDTGEVEEYTKAIWVFTQ